MSLEAVVEREIVPEIKREPESSADASSIVVESAEEKTSKAIKSEELASLLVESDPVIV